jgi:hypothetical protein
MAPSSPRPSPRSLSSSHGLRRRHRWRLGDLSLAVVTSSSPPRRGRLFRPHARQPPAPGSPTTPPRQVRPGSRGLASIPDRLDRPSSHRPHAGPCPGASLNSWRAPSSNWSDASCSCFLGGAWLGTRVSGPTRLARPRGSGSSRPSRLRTHRPRPAALRLDPAIPLRPCRFSPAWRSRGG